MFQFLTHVELARSMVVAILEMPQNLIILTDTAQ